MTISLVILFASLGIAVSQRIKSANRLSRNILFLASKINEVRSLALAPKQLAPSGRKICGFGIMIENFPTQKGKVFMDLVGSGNDCANSDHILTNNNEILEEFSLEPQIRIKSVNLGGGALTRIDVLYLPPEPKVYFNGSLANSDLNFVLEELSTNETKNLTITSLGQFNF